MLVIGPSWVGDMVMSQSLYIALKQQNPDALIDVMAPAWCKPILERMPEVNRALELPFGHGEFQFLRVASLDCRYVVNMIMPMFCPIPPNLL